MKASFEKGRQHKMAKRKHDHDEPVPPGRRDKVWEETRRKIGNPDLPKETPQDPRKHK